MEEMNGRPFISIAAPAHNEAGTLPELVRRVEATLSNLGVDWEMVIADDGSTDGTRELLRDLTAEDPRIKAVLLSRNYGHTPAYLAALANTSGQWVALMDSDLQDEPEVIPKMLEATSDGAEIVYAIKAKRKESLPLRAAFSLYYWLAGRMSSVDQPRHAGPFCLLSRRVVVEIVAMPERSFFFPGVRAYVGFKQTGLPVERPPRATGRSRITLRRRISGALDGILAFSTAPLRIAAWLGLLVALLTAIIELFFIFFKLFADVAVPGFTALVTLILFLGGVQLFTLGIVGEYLGKVYDEVKRRPRFIVEESLNVEPGLTARQDASKADEVVV